MSITDELREWVKSLYTPNSGELKLQAERIADRIDAEHESKVSYWQDASYKDGYDEGFASADDYFTDKRETLKEHGWVKLPVDADGVPIRVGDVMCNTHKDGFMAKRVTGLCAHSSGRWTVEVDEAKLRWHDADKLCHYTPPTVEDVLREFAGTLAKADCNWGSDVDEAVAEYAAKLRLRGDGE